jgi:AraC-like DNA-binding protein
MMVFPFKQPSVTGFLHGGDEGSAYPNSTMDTAALLHSNSVHGICYFEGEVNFVMVMLRPTAAYHLIRENVQGMANTFLSLKDLGNSQQFKELQERLWDVATPTAAVALIQVFLQKYFERSARFNPGDFTPVMEYMLQSDGRMEVQDLSKKFKCSERWIEKMCAMQTGLSPKTWLRLIRYRAAANHFLAKPNVTWMEVVARFGYTDQSHLIRDFKHFSGNPPAQHFAQELDTEVGFRQNEIGLSGMIGSRD